MIRAHNAQENAGLIASPGSCTADVTHVWIRSLPPHSYAGMTQIRFYGYFSALTSCEDTPCGVSATLETQHQAVNLKLILITGGKSLDFGKARHG